MQDWVIGIIAFICACTVSVVELWTSRYFGTFFVIWKNFALWVYGSIYGTIGGMLAGFKILHLEVTGISNPVVQAILVGISIKSILDLRLFSITTDRSIRETDKTDDTSNTFPVGLATFVETFRSPIIQTLDKYENYRLHKFLDPYIHSYSDVETVKNKVISNLPHNIIWQKRKALSQDIEDNFKGAPNEVIIFESFYLYILTTGKNNFKHTFPLSNISVANPV